MAYNVLQQDIDLLFQSQKELFSKVEILNSNFKILHEVQGLLVSDSYSINAESDIRRTYNCNILLDDNSYWIQNRYGLMNKYIRPYVGIKNIRTNEIVWYLMGTYCFINSNWTYNETERTLSLSCADLMCMLNGSINGNMRDYKITIYAGENVRNAIAAIMDEFYFIRYILTDIDKTIPYDLEFSGQTYYDILKEILELYNGYEMFFDLYGTFIVQQTPIKLNDRSIINDEIIQPLLISENGSFSFEGVCNHVKVYGRVIESDRLLEGYSYSGNIYQAISNDISEYENFTTYALYISDYNRDSPRLNINYIGAKYIVHEDGTPLKEFELYNGMYVFMYRKLTDDFLLLGQYQVFGEAYNDDLNNPFSRPNLGQKIVKVCQGGEYEKIYCDDLARHRAEYELYLAGNMNERISLEMISIPWLDVNNKIEYTSKSTNETQDYIIKSISGSTVESTMNVEAIRYYADYSEIY